MKSSHPVSRAVLVGLTAFIIIVAHIQPKWKQTQTEATLSWDVYGYYLYLPAVFIYDDLYELKFADSLFQQYRPAGDMHAAVTLPDGRYVMKYPVGMALMYSPFFGVGHLVAGGLGYPQDGFSRPYQQAIGWGMLLYAALGLILLRRLLLLYVDDRIAALVMTILVLATNYLNYTAIDGAMTHNVLFTLTTALLLLTHRWHIRPDLRTALAMGGLIGLATIIRPTEILTLMIPALWGIWNRETFFSKLQQLWKHYTHVLILGAGLVAVGCLQLLYWKQATGQWLYYSYEEYGFYWTRPHIYEGLFSYRKGWLVYTPVMILALIGFVPLYRQMKGVFLPALVFMTTMIYVVYAWDVWWYGGSFGSRPLIQYYALLALPMGALLQVMLRRRWASGLAGGFVLFCIWMNLIMTWQAHAPDGNWSAESMTRAYFWRIFGKIEADRADKKFLDVRHELRSLAGMSSRTLYTQDFETDTTLYRTDQQAAGGTYAGVLDQDHQFSPGYTTTIGELRAKPKSWIRARVDARYEQPEWNEWKFTQLSIIFFRGDKVLKETNGRLQRIAGPGNWFEYRYEMKIPSNLQPDDVMKVYLWHATSATVVWVDNLAVTLIEPQ
ncbi:MAG: hypothetical protein SF053_06970 [Bacteroidia bacterium]|nr:hypothetical protein [Bacteroidia bacterium]